MITISMLVYKDTFGSAIFPTIDLINSVNDFMLASTGKSFFNLRLIGYKTQMVKINAHTAIRCEQTIKEPPISHIILLPAVKESFLDVMDLNYYDALGDWLHEAYQKGSKICSMCLGSIILAHTGLLNGLPCTTHWIGNELMRVRFPSVRMETSKTITKKNNIYTSGGAFSSLQLIFLFIEEYCSKKVALHFSKILGIEYPIKLQNRFFIFKQQKAHQDNEIKQIQEFMEAHFYQKIAIQDLAPQVNMSERNFIRRFKKATGNTPIAYLQKIRIEAAKKAFEEGNTNVSNIMYKCGYEDIKSFRVLFKKLTGFTPSAYSKKFQVEH